MLAETSKALLDVLCTDLEGLSQKDPALSPFLPPLKSVNTTTVHRGPFDKLCHPAMSHLDRALERIDGSQALPAAAAQAARHVDWTQTYSGGGDGIDARLVDGMLSAQVAGSYGCFASTNVAAGEFLIAPGVYYPMHTHASQELYYCMSGRLQLQHGVDGVPFSIDPGRYSITPPNRVHALWVEDEPVLLVYVWIGDLKCPIWIWSQAENGDWQRSLWKREPGQPWRRVSTEPVSDQAYREAHQEG